MREESQIAEAIVNGDDNHSAFLHQWRRVIVATCPRDKSSAMNPHHHRKALAVVLVITVLLVVSLVSVVQAGPENVQRQTILAAIRATGGGWLWANTAEVGCFKNPCPAA